MRVLVTGGAGFIGSHLCDRLVRDKKYVVCLDNFLSGNLVNIRHLLTKQNFRLVKGDIRNFELLEKLIRDVDVIFHLAAQIHTDRSIVEPKLTYDINVLGTQNILEVARAYGTRQIIYASSSEVYGSAIYTPMDEEHPLNALHPYGASKVAADRMCYSYIKTYGMKINIIRPFNVFGPRQKSTGYGGVISLFTKRVLDNMPPIIYGDGKQTRDYTYIVDLISAYGKVLSTSRYIEEPINIGTGEDISILDLAYTIIDLCGKTDLLQPAFTEARPGEVQQLVADNARAKNLLSWKPSYNLNRGLEQFIHWFSLHNIDGWSKPLQQDP